MEDGFVRKFRRASRQEPNPMRDLLIAAVFIAMLLSPAIVAAFSGTSEATAE
jgi:hypothetical protein